MATFSTAVLVVWPAANADCERVRSKLPTNIIDSVVVVCDVCFSFGAVFGRLRRTTRLQRDLAQNKTECLLQ